MLGHEFLVPSDARGNVDNGIFAQIILGLSGVKRISEMNVHRMMTKQKNISVNVLLEMLATTGYTLTIVPSGPKLKDGEYEVTINE